MRRLLFSPEPGSGIPALLRAGVLAGGGSQTYSGSVVTFTAKRARAVKSLTAAISPVQDLHGQDAPYPAGGGANQWDEQWELGVWDSNGVKSSSETSIRSVGYIPVTPGASYYVFYGTRYTSGLIFRSYDSNKDFVGTILRQSVGILTVPEGVYYLTFCTFGANNITTYANDISVNSPATVTTYAPYSNICPISGWDAVNVTRTGKNLLRPASTDTKTENGVTWVKNSDGSIEFSGTCTQSFATNFVEFKLPAGSYLYSNVGSTFNYTGGNRPHTYIRDLDHATTLAAIDPGQVSTGTSFTLAEETNVRFYAVFQTDNVLNGVFYPMLRLATVSDATYAPYTGQTYPIDLGRTVYGGSLDVTNGVLTVDRVVVDMGTLDWQSYSSYSSFVTRISDKKPLQSGASYADGIISSMYKAVNFWWTSFAKPDKTMSCGSDQSVVVKDTAYTDADTFKTAMSGVRLVYELATPQTYQLAPTEVDTLLGNNCIWADTGDIIVIV